MCTLSMKMSEPMPAKNEKMKEKSMMSVKGGKRRGEKLQQGWKVTKGARERNPGGWRGNFGNAIQLSKITCSTSEDKSTQTTKVIDRGLEVDKFWNKKVQRSQLENISKVKIGFI